MNIIITLFSTYDILILFSARIITLFIDIIELCIKVRLKEKEKLLNKETCESFIYSSRETIQFFDLFSVVSLL